MSVYSESFADILINCESILGVYNIVGKSGLEFVPIIEFYKKLKKVKGSEEHRKNSMIECGYYMASLSYTRGRCSFQRINILDFSRHNRVDLLADLLIPFNKRENLTRDVKNNIISLVKYLEVLEAQTREFIGTLSYRYIRLFVTLLYLGDYTHASMISEFILDQIFMSEDIDNSVRQKLDTLLKSRKEVDDLADRYVRNSDDDRNSNNIKDKSSRVIKKAMNVFKEDSTDSDYIGKIKRDKPKDGFEESETTESSSNRNVNKEENTRKEDHNKTDENEPMERVNSFEGRSTRKSSR